MTDGADEFEETVRRTIEEYKIAGRRSELQNVIKKMRIEHQEAEPSLPPALCYVEGETREHYLHDMRSANAGQCSIAGSYRFCYYGSSLM